MSKRQIQDYLQDLLDAIAAIEEFTREIEFEPFSQNLEKVACQLLRKSILRQAWW